MPLENTNPIGGDALKVAAEKYLEEVRLKTNGADLRFLGIFDKWFIRVMTRLSSLDPSRPWEESVKEDTAKAPGERRISEWDFFHLRLFLDRWRQGRFVSYDQREKSGGSYHPKYGTEFGEDVLLTCQGAPSFMEWRGLPLMKTVFDFALYPQLMTEIRPQSIFEIGSGSGASALWLADYMTMLGIAGHVHSVDLVPVAKKETPHVTFYQGDCSRPDTLFPHGVLASAPHPWLLIEDAHHNVEAVLDHFHAFLKKGDYMIVEDSEIKRGDLRRFLAKHPNAYDVDTKYTDFFGRNATCALDSIFKKTRD